MMLRADLPAQGAVRSDEELVDAAQDDGDTDEGEKPWESGGHGLRNEQPAGLPKSPKQPSAQDIAMHNLTHFPYRDWCPHCVASRRPNTPHRSRALEERKIPLVVADYCYLRDSKDQDLATCLVVGVYPYRMTMATVVDMKGRDENAIKRVSKFFKMCGLTHFAMKSDQETSRKALLDEAVTMAGKSSVLEPTVAAPEMSSVGESQSNGKAERTVQRVEDQIRTLKSATEGRFSTGTTGYKIQSTHATMDWMVEYGASLCSKYSVGDDGKSAFERLHGKRANEHLVEFGEKVMYYIPKARRAKLDRRFGIGVFMGKALWGDDNFISRADGTVVKARGLARMPPGNRWDATMFSAVKDRPQDAERPNTADDVEATESPHAAIDAAVDDLDDNAHQEAREDAGARAMRLTKGMCKKCGYTEACPRCRVYRTGNQSLRRKTHTLECRAAIYEAMRAAGDLRLRETNPDVSKPDADDPQVGDPFNEIPGLIDDHPDDVPDIDCPPTEIVDLQSDDDFLTGDFLDGGEMSVDVDTVTDILMTCGVDVLTARRKACSLAKDNPDRVIAAALKECDLHRSLWARQHR